MSDTLPTPTKQPSYSNLRVPRPKSWAQFQCQDDFGYPRVVSVPVRYWAINEAGQIVGLVGDPDVGLKDARSYSNFLSFDHVEMHQ